MGIAIGGKAIESGRGLVIGGKEVSGIATGGKVIFESEVEVPPSAGWELIAHTGVSEGSYMTTPSIDTTGADLLVVVGAVYLMRPVPLPSDNKGNSWVEGISNLGGNSGIGLAYCRGGIVGLGHTFNWTGDYGAVQVLAFKGSVSDTADKSSGASIFNAAVIRPGEIIPSVDNSLIVTGCSHNDQIHSIDSDFIITDLFPAGAQMAGAAAYLVQAAAAAVNPGWAITSSGYSADAVVMSFRGV